MTNADFTKVRTYVHTHHDKTQTLVTIHPDGTVTIAQRYDRWSTWGPPHQCEDTTWQD